MIRLISQIVRNMGPRYVLFRAWYELRRRTGLLRLAFPTSEDKRTWVSLEEWRKRSPRFLPGLPSEAATFTLDSAARERLRADIDRIERGELCFFHGEWRNLGKDYDWLTHPLTGFRFDRHRHWTQVEDFGEGQGDIKYVWEPSRFSFVQTLIRADHHLGTDHAALAFARIRSWLDANRPNCGPHYKCSQEQVLRVLNWMIALSFYRDSPALDQALFGRIMGAIHRQLQHVERNLAFSRIAVRNNHAISEGLGLYVVGTLWPWFPESLRWRKLGKRVLEEEGLYQIARDGSYIQHSMTYERMVVQLYSIALAVARRAGDSFSSALHERLAAMLDFLLAHQDERSGWLPNYGPNDGSLVLQLTSCGYRDFRPQLNSLAGLLGRPAPYQNGPWTEEAAWVCPDVAAATKGENAQTNMGARSFDCDGYYVLRAPDRFAMIRCGNHRQRPAHADMLHLDIWHEGVNLLRDAGTYHYNDAPEVLDHFMGGAGHNTVMLENQSQMRRGPRFIWFDWSRCKDARVVERDGVLCFEGAIEAFRHVASGIVHRRVVRMHTERVLWEVEDTVTGYEGTITQCWNLDERFGDMGFELQCRDAKGEVPAQSTQGWYSETYGVRVEARQIRCSSTQGTMVTRIGLRSELHAPEAGGS